MSATTLFKLPRHYDPQWTELEYKRQGGRDYLGIETLSESILADLLPGINNQTRRARYYSFWAWMLRDFIQDTETRHTQNRFYAWARTREAAFILAYLCHGCNTGAAGTDQGSKVWQDGEPTTYSLNWKSLLSVEGGSYQLYYRGPLQEMNIIRPMGDSPHDNLTKTIGLGLAEAFEASVTSTTYVKQYLHATHLSKAEISDLAQHGCLCQVNQSSMEIQRLREAFFQFETADQYAVKRLASLCLFMDIIKQAEGLPLHTDAFRATLYFWSYNKDRAYEPEGNLITPAQRWQIFQLRQYYVFFIESFWSLFLQRVEVEALTEETYLSWLVENFDLAKLSATFNFDLQETDPWQLPLQTLYEAIYNALPPTAFEPGVTIRHYKLNEYWFEQQIYRNSSQFDVEILAGYALLGLALIYWRCQAWRQESGWFYVSEKYAAGHLSTEAYLHHIDHAFEQGWTVAQWLGWFHKRYLWLQHRRVALEKLIAGGKERAMFELLQGDSPDLEGGNRQAAPRYHALGTDVPKMNAPRFPSALMILADLDLIERLSGQVYRLLPEGEALLERFRTYSIPRASGG